MCTWKGQQVTLTVTEFLLLKALAARPGYVKSRDLLMDAAYGEHVYVDDRTIDSHITRVRRKFQAADPEFAAIATLYGVGYRYRPGRAAPRSTAGASHIRGPPPTPPDIHPTPH